MSKSECLICCNPMDTDVSSLICIHKDIFHEECLNKWGKGRCPLCRAKYNNKLIDKYKKNTEYHG